MQPPKLKSSLVRNMTTCAFALLQPCLTLHHSLAEFAISPALVAARKAYSNKLTPPAGDSTGRTDRLLTPQLSDERSDPKFQVAVSRQTAPENETEALAQLEVVRMKDSRGREFNCYLPAAADGTADGDRREVGAGCAELGTCMAALNGWAWTLHP